MFTSASPRFELLKPCTMHLQVECLRGPPFKTFLPIDLYDNITDYLENKDCADLEGTVASYTERTVEMYPTNTRVVVE